MEKECKKANCTSHNSKEKCGQCTKDSMFEVTPPKKKAEGELSEPKVENEYQEYWMVHRGHSSNMSSRTVATYDSEAKAAEQAMKLALDNPDKSFYVLKTVAVFRSKVEKSFLDFRTEGNIK